MADKEVEILEFDGLKVPIQRQQVHETYIALQPPDAQPYVVTTMDTKPDDIIAFIQHWLEVIRELRVEMLKRFEKSKSLKCHYRTGDVVYVLGRPFMLRVYPLTTTKRHTKGMRGRAKIKSDTQTEVSVISLYLMKPGDYDQGRGAFLSYAKPILINNARSLVEQCLARSFPGEPIPKKINCRPMRDSWVHIESRTNTVWFSERLLPYPADCVVYAFLAQYIKNRKPDISVEEQHEILERGVPHWQRFRAILDDPNSVYAQTHAL